MTAGIPWLFDGAVDPRGGSFNLLFNVPATVATLSPVSLVLKKITAKSTLSDEDGSADFIATVRINSREGSHTYPINTASINTPWTVKRPILSTTATVSFVIEIVEHDPAESYHSKRCGTKCCYCATEPSESGTCRTYLGACESKDDAVDINPDPSSGSGLLSSSNKSIEFSLNTQTGAVTGDVTGKLGDTLTSVGDEDFGATIEFQIVKD